MKDTRTFFINYFLESTRSMYDDLRALRINPGGFVLLSKDFSVMAKRVNSKNEHDWLNLYKEEQNTDAWYIHLMAGSIAKAKEVFKTLPHEPYVVFHRGMRDEQKAHKLPTSLFLG